MMPEARESPLAGPLLSVAGFAVWSVFSLLPIVAGQSRIREAWDTEAYWLIGLPLLMLSLAAAGFATGTPAWKLAAWTAGGHFLGALMLTPAGSGFGLLPFALVFIGVPMFAALFCCAWLGRLAGRALRPSMR